jgi:hypothetical protein
MVSGILSFLFVLVSASLVIAADADPAATVDYAKAIVLGCSFLAAGMGIGVVGIPKPMLKLIGS